MFTVGDMVTTKFVNDSDYAGQVGIVIRTINMLVMVNFGTKIVIFTQYELTAA